MTASYGGPPKRGGEPAAKIRLSTRLFSKIFPNSIDWNMALIWMISGQVIGEIKTTLGIYMAYFLWNSPNVSGCAMISKKETEIVWSFTKLGITKLLNPLGLEISVVFMGIFKSFGQFPYWKIDLSVCTFSLLPDPHPFLMGSFLSWKQFDQGFPPTIPWNQNLDISAGI